MIVEVVHLWPLFCVDDVLLDEGMDIEAVPDLLYDLGPVDPNHVYPGDRRARLQVGALVDGGDAELLKMIQVVVHDCDPDRFGPLLAIVDEGAGRQAHLLRFDLEDPSHLASHLPGPVEPRRAGVREIL